MSAPHEPGASLADRKAMSNFRDLEVWKKCRALARDVYRETTAFPRSEMFCLVQQMRRAILSAVCNIAEAHGRVSSRDRIHFLVMSRGSLFELEAQTVIANDLEYVAESTRDQLLAQISEAIRILNGLIRHYTR
jgi:four helix bundle protein